MKKNKPAPELTPEEILRKVCRYGNEIINDNDEIIITEAKMAMQEYAELYHKEKLRGELKAFNNFVLKLEEEGKIPLIDRCIDEYLKTKE